MAYQGPDARRTRGRWWVWIGGLLVLVAILCLGAAASGLIDLGEHGPRRHSPDAPPTDVDSGGPHDPSPWDH